MVTKRGEQEQMRQKPHGCRTGKERSRRRDKGGEAVSEQGNGTSSSQTSFSQQLWTVENTWMKCPSRKTRKGWKWHPQSSEGDVRSHDARAKVRE